MNAITESTFDSNANLMQLGDYSVPTQLFIGNVWRAGESGNTIDVFDPSTESVLASVADASEADAIEAVSAAHAAGAGWAAVPPRKRAELLNRCYELMMARVDWFAGLIALENGKALADARGEAVYAAEFFRWYAEEAVRIIGDVSLSPAGDKRILVEHSPIGVAVLVTPWNFPAAMATRKIAPALAAGCTCVLKPATETPLTAYAIAALMAEAGVPAGVVNVITTSKSGRTVSAMLHDPRVRKLSFTGSTEVGRILLREAADNIISCAMELGGNAPFIVFDDADIDAAIDGAMIAKMRNGGEACTAANRFYVQRGVHDAFAERLAHRMSALVVDDGNRAATGCGPMINRAAVVRIAELVDHAREGGARVLTGGDQPERKGFFYSPTVLVGIAPDARVLSEEIFGPVAPIVAFDTEDEVVALANDTEYGLVAYVYTGDMKRGMRIVDRLESGMVGLNRGLVSDPAAPFGGVKQSGLGREGAHHGLMEYLEAKYVAVQW
jgi:succinate-semialdehyde dehydrogenase/glutarate-semialdehyde dehydrogenase